MRRAHWRRPGRATAALAALGTAVLAACTGTSSPAPSRPATALAGHLTWWDIATQTGAVAADTSLAQGFMAAHPGVTVDVQVLAPQDARTRFDTLAQSASGAPDVITVDNSWIPEWGYRGYLAKLDTTVVAPATQDVFPSLAGVQKWDGRVVAAARSADPMALLYNPRLLARAGVSVPHSWADIAETRLRLTAKDVETLYAPSTGDGLLPWIYGAGGTLADTDAKLITVNQPAAVAGLTQRLELQATGVVVDDSSPTATDTMRTLFRNGKVAMILDYADALPLVVGGPAFPTQRSVGVTWVPAGPAKSSGPLEGTSYGVYSGLSNLEVAYLFVAYLETPASQALLAERLGLLPSRPATYAEPGVRDDPVVTAFKLAVQHGTPLPQVQVQSDLLPPLADALQSAAAGNGPPRSVLDDVATTYEKLLPGFSTKPGPN